MNLNRFGGKICIFSFEKIENESERIWESIYKSFNWL